MGLIKEGLKTFQLGLVTAITTDWSNIGIAYALRQKRCPCPETPEAMDLSCCKSGWNLIMVASRYCSDAETRYAPVEGEALGVHFALEKCKYFTYGLSLIHI